MTWLAKQKSDGSYAVMEVSDSEQEKFARQRGYKPLQTSNGKPINPGKKFSRSMIHKGVEKGGLRMFDTDQMTAPAPAEDPYTPPGKTETAVQARLGRIMEHMGAPVAPHLVAATSPETVEQAGARIQKAQKDIPWPEEALYAASGMTLGALAPGLKHLQKPGAGRGAIVGAVQGAASANSTDPTKVGAGALVGGAMGALTGKFGAAGATAGVRRQASNVAAQELASAAEQRAASVAARRAAAEAKSAAKASKRQAEDAMLSAKRGFEDAPDFPKRDAEDALIAMRRKAEDASEVSAEKIGALKQQAAGADKNWRATVSAVGDSITPQGYFDEQLFRSNFAKLTKGSAEDVLEAFNKTLLSRDAGIPKPGKSKIGGIAGAVRMISVADAGLAFRMYSALYGVKSLKDMVNKTVKMNPDMAQRLANEFIESGRLNTPGQRAIAFFLENPGSQSAQQMFARIAVRELSKDAANAIPSGSEERQAAMQGRPAARR